MAVSVIPPFEKVDFDRKFIGQRLPEGAVGHYLPLGTWENCPAESPDIIPLPTPGKLHPATAPDVTNFIRCQGDQYDAAHA